MLLHQRAQLVLTLPQPADLTTLSRRVRSVLLRLRRRHRCTRPCFLHVGKPPRRTLFRRRDLGRQARNLSLGQAGATARCCCGYLVICLVHGLVRTGLRLPSRFDINSLSSLGRRLGLGHRLGLGGSRHGLGRLEGFRGRLLGRGKLLVPLLQSRLQRWDVNGGPRSLCSQARREACDLIRKVAGANVGSREACGRLGTYGVQLMLEGADIGAQRSHYGHGGGDGGGRIDSVGWLHAEPLGLNRRWQWYGCR